MLYFAYGSNMCPSKLAKAARGASFASVGRAEGFDLRFHKESKKDGSGKADAFATGNPADVVWGVLFEVPSAAWQDLVDSEGGYRECEVTVETITGPRQAKTFLAKPSRIRPNLRPYAWYKRFVVEGARMHGLPSTYIARIDAMPVAVDTNAEREATNAAVQC